MIPPGISPVEYAISMLMSRSKLPMRLTIEPEQVICIEFADLMRRATVAGQYCGIWGHVPNEGKRHQLVALILKAMGLIPGGTDYFFMWPGNNGVIEFKVPERYRIDPQGKRIKVQATDLGDNQVHYRTWCEHAGIPHAVCRSPEEGIAALQAWGAFVSAA